MQLHPLEDGSWTEFVERIRGAYFSDPRRRLHLKKGEMLLEQDAFNDRLFFILSGLFRGTIRTQNELGEEQQIELFLARKGDFVGVVSFFSPRMCSVTRVTCTEDAEVAWISQDTPPVQEEKYGTLYRQFLPVITEELLHRQMALSQTAREREAALRRLHLSEKLSTLGRLSAGLAHELNNAIGVLVRSSEYLTESLKGVMRKNYPNEIDWLEKGSQQGQAYPSAVVRASARQLEKDFGLDYDTAKRLARIFGPDTPGKLPENLEKCLNIWEMGQACHDMRLAAQHAASIVSSVKQLGGDSEQRRAGINVNQTLREALALVQSERRSIGITLHLDEHLPAIWGNSSELTQIWINIIKNACEALKEAHTENPSIVITTSAQNHRAVVVDLCNNGPRIPDHMLHNIFLPNITTKKSGSAVGQGLGLGLAIVKRLVDSYCGELRLDTNDEKTCFRVILPLHHETVTIEP